MHVNIQTILANGAAAMHVPLETTLRDKLTHYALELKKWSKSMNLVGKAADETLIETHFLDSLTLLPALMQEPSVSELLDVGSGAGFPGLVIKAACPELPVTLMEPRQKRVFFLKHIIRTLGLCQVNIVAARLEMKSSAPRTFSAVTCRAFSSIRDFLPLAQGVTHPGSKVFFMKGPAGPEEVLNWQQENSGDAFVFTAEQSLRLPFSGAERRILVFTRI